MTYFVFSLFIQFKNFIKLYAAIHMYKKFDYVINQYLYYNATLRFE